MAFLLGLFVVAAALPDVASAHVGRTLPVATLGALAGCVLGRLRETQ